MKQKLKHIYDLGIMDKRLKSDKQDLYGQTQMHPEA